MVDVNGSGRGLIDGAIEVFVWKKLRKTSWLWTALNIFVYRPEVARGTSQRQAKIVTAWDKFMGQFCVFVHLVAWKKPENSTVLNPKI